MISFISLEQVGFSWPKGQMVLRGINLDIQKDDTIALMGANGSGKTTLGRLMMGMLSPTQGQVMLAGQPLRDYSLSQLGRRVGYVFQNPEKQLFAATVAEDIGFGLRYRGLTQENLQSRVQEMLSLFELEHCAHSFPFNLSHGEKQRLALAGIMALEPEFIILDEPSTGLDWLRKQRLITVLERVRERGVGYLLISHDHGFCRGICAKALTLKEGQLC